MKTLVHLEPLPTLAASFAVEEHLTSAEDALARLWRHGAGIVPGLRDMRLPLAAQAVAQLRSRGVDVHVRSSGGRLVVLDEGVLNVAIAFSGQGLPTIEEGYLQMTRILSSALSRFGLEARVGEIPGSICPGSKDLSVGGRKVAGLSQRRRREFALVHAFLLVEGTGVAREERAMEFYRLAGALADEGVRPGTMAAVAEFAQGTTVKGAAQALREILERL